MIANVVHSAQLLDLPEMDCENRCPKLFVGLMLDHIDQLVCSQALVLAVRLTKQHRWSAHRTKKIPQRPRTVFKSALQE